MSLEVSVHDAQTSILRELLFRPTAGYAELQKPTGLEGDHFNFHLTQLVKKGLVEKTARGRYQLSTLGKEYANKLDTDSNTIERQPKVSVILVVWQDERRQSLLMQERLKNPYFGFWGYPTGKMRWGETIVEAAARELLEETGLTAAFTVHGIYHEHAYKHDSSDLLEDKLFLITSTTKTSGTLLDGEGCRNRWVTINEAKQFEKRFPGHDTVKAIINHEYLFVERDAHYSPEQF